MLSLVCIFFLIFFLFFPRGTLCLPLTPFLELCLIFDTWNLLFFLLLLVNSISVITWSYFYMAEDTDFRYFVSCLSCFLASILVLCFSGSLLSAFLG